MAGCATKGLRPEALSRECGYSSLGAAAWQRARLVIHTPNADDEIVCQ
jgi:hypothetical protein